MNDKIKEQIKFNTELLKLVAGIFIGTFGTALALILKGDIDGLTFTFIMSGLLVSLVCIYAGIKLLMEIQKDIDGMA